MNKPCSFRNYLYLFLNEDSPEGDLAYDSKKTHLKDIRSWKELRNHIEHQASLTGNYNPQGAIDVARKMWSDWLMAERNR